MPIIRSYNNCSSRICCIWLVDSVENTGTHCCSRNLWSHFDVFISPQTSLPFKFATFDAESLHFTSEICCTAVWYCLHTSCTKCLRENLPYFGRSFRRLNDVVVTKSTYTRSWTITEILTRQKNVVSLRFHVLCMFIVHCAGPSLYR